MRPNREKLPGVVSGYPIHDIKFNLVECTEIQRNFVFFQMCPKGTRFDSKHAFTKFLKGIKVFENTTS